MLKKTSYSLSDRRAMFLFRQLPYSARRASFEALICFAKIPIEIINQGIQKRLEELTQLEGSDPRVKNIAMKSKLLLLQIFLATL